MPVFFVVLKFPDVITKTYLPDYISKTESWIEEMFKNFKETLKKHKNL